MDKLGRLCVGVVGAVVLTIEKFRGRGLRAGTSTLACDALLSVIPLLTILLKVTGKFNFRGAMHRRLFSCFPKRRIRLAGTFRFIRDCLRRTRNNMVVKINLVLLFCAIIGLVSSVRSAFGSV